MNEREAMKVINVDGIESCVRRFGFRQTRQISNIHLGRFTPDAFYDKAKRVLLTPEEDLRWLDKVYLWMKKDDLPTKGDAPGIVKGGYDIVRMIPVNRSFASGVGPHQIGVVEIGRMPFEGRERRWAEEARIELHEELDVGLTESVPPLAIHLIYNEQGDERLVRADYSISNGRRERANFEKYFPTAEIVRMGAVGKH